MTHNNEEIPKELKKESEPGRNGERAKERERASSGHEGRPKGRGEQSTKKKC